MSEALQRILRHRTIDADSPILEIAPLSFVTMDQKDMTAKLPREAARRLWATLELARRISRARVPRALPMGSPDELARYLFLHHADSHQEVLGALYLDVTDLWMEDRVIFRGNGGVALGPPQHILRPAMSLGASRILIFHNHPNGNPRPDDQDLLYTVQVRAAAAAVGLELVDHWILASPSEWQSIRRWVPPEDEPACWHQPQDRPPDADFPYLLHPRWT